MKNDEEKEILKLQKEIKKLKRIAEQKDFEIDFLDKMIEIASEEYGIEIKNSKNAPSSILKNKDKKDK